MVNKIRQNFILVILMKTKYLLEYFFFLKHHLNKKELGGGMTVGPVAAGDLDTLTLSSGIPVGEGET